MSVLSVLLVPLVLSFFFSLSGCTLCLCLSVSLHVSVSVVVLAMRMVKIKVDRLSHLFLKRRVELVIFALQSYPGHHSEDLEPEGEAERPEVTVPWKEADGPKSQRRNVKIKQRWKKR